MSAKPIYVHIPRTGGTSIREYFGTMISVVRHDVYSHSCDTLRTLLRHPDVPEDVFVFTFVRNPWDRLVSAWEYMRFGGSRNKIDKWDYETFLLHHKTFNKFVECEIATGRALGAIHFRPQNKWVRGLFKRNRANFVGRYERIQDDMLLLEHKIGKPVDGAFQRLNKSDREDWREYYTQETFDAVGEVYIEDIDMFKYGEVTL